MTEQPADEALYDDGPDAEVLHFDGPRVEPTERATVPFRIGDDPRILYSRRPKYAIIMRLLRITESKDPTVQYTLVDEFLEAALDTGSRDYLRDRFEDPDDEWDYEVLIPVIEQLGGRWFPGVPPGRSGGSGRTQNRSGRRSTVRARSGA